MSVSRLLAVTAAACTVTAFAATASQAAQPDSVGRHIVVLRDTVADPAGVAAEHGNKYGASVSYVYGSALKGYAATIPDRKLNDLRKDSRVLFVSDDREVSASAQTVPTGINRMDADLSSQHSGDAQGAVGGFAVAVLDTGSGPHPDLNVVGGTNCSTGGSKNYSDGNGHGTHVAGTIGAKDDGNGVVGVAPSVPIYSVRVLNSQGSGSWSSIVCGIDWVTANARSLNIKVASMSLGGPGSDDNNCGNSNSDALHKALCKSVAAGVTYVVAAGNDGTDMAKYVPATYSEALTVSAVADYNGLPGGGAAPGCYADVDDTAADFSNYATLSLDAAHMIAAPGVCINSTWRGGGYNTISGTSMATPHVSGLVALCIASGACSGMTPAQIAGKLRADAAAQPGTYGFAEDPSHGGARYYGYLAYAGGY